MPFDWREYLQLAKDLVGQANMGYSSEAAKRSAVSRAYYSAFCWVRNYAEKNLGFQREGSAEDHRSLRDCLQRRNKAKLASLVNKLRRWRNDCDYKDEVPNLDRYVQNAIKNAEDAIKECT